MDPDEVLARLRALVDKDEWDADDMGAMSDYFDALDTWLSKGGFLPAAWNP
jgi:hypothetical protein